MVKYTVEEVTDKKTWEDFVLAQNPQSFLQSWNWGETAKIGGDTVSRLGFYDEVEGKKLVGVALLIKQEARRGPHLLIPAGPLIDWSNSELVDVFLHSVKQLGRQKGVWFVRVRPELLDTQERRMLFKKLGFVSAPMHLHAENTWVLNIEPSEENLLMGMRKTTRYLVRKSLKMDLEFELSTNPDDAKTLKKLQDETVSRHKFVGFPESVFRGQIETFGKDEQGALLMCKKGKEVLAAAIIIFYGGIAYYHHSASTLRYPGIPSSHFLQWNIIREAKKRGCKKYNFWGVAPSDDPKHRFAGVTLFKKGFGGEKVDWLHARDLPLSPLYWVTYVFESLRRKVRGL